MSCETYIECAVDSDELICSANAGYVNLYKRGKINYQQVDRKNCDHPQAIHCFLASKSRKIDVLIMVFEPEMYKPLQTPKVYVERNLLFAMDGLTFKSKH